MVSFAFFSVLIILKANGYQLNWRYWKITKTGMIILDGDPQDVKVKINQKYLEGFPLRLSNLTPGSYEVTVTKAGYQSWQKNFNVGEGRAVIIENIVLFLQEPRDATKPDLSPQQVANEFQNFTNQIEIKGDELHWQNNLVTRFGSQVLSAVIYPDNSHFIVQLNNEIRVIDLDGSNNLLLFKLTSSEPTAITFRDNGRTIIFLDNGQIGAKTIR